MTIREKVIAAVESVWGKMYKDWSDPDLVNAMEEFVRAEVIAALRRTWADADTYRVEYYENRARHIKELEE